MDFLRGEREIACNYCGGIGDFGLHLLRDMEIERCDDFFSSAGDGYPRGGIPQVTLNGWADGLRIGARGN